MCCHWQSWAMVQHSVDSTNRKPEKCPSCHRCSVYLVICLISPLVAGFLFAPSHSFLSSQPCWTGSTILLFAALTSMVGKWWSLLVSWRPQGILTVELPPSHKHIAWKFYAGVLTKSCTIFWSENFQCSHLKWAWKGELKSCKVFNCDNSDYILLYRICTIYILPLLEGTPRIHFYR